jgi:hypothetical protein
MARRSALAVTTVLVLTVFILGFQTSRAFDLDAYRQHLDENRDLTAAQIIDSKRPYGPYLASVSPSSEPEYLADLATHYALTEGELQLIQQHGFMVSERLRFESYGAALEDIWHADLPVFVSSDAIRHALHRSYVQILASVETRREPQVVLVEDAPQGRGEVANGNAAKVSGVLESFACVTWK